MTDTSTIVAPSSSCSATPASDGQMYLTAPAAQRIASLMQQENNTKLFLRVFVEAGGCSGYKYGMTFDDQIEEGDHAFEHHGVRVVADAMSLEILAGSTVDFVETMMGSGFVVKNPRAKASCGCGSSFSA